MDDVERIQAYILGRLDREPQAKADVIDAFDENRGDDRDSSNLRSRTRLLTEDAPCER